MRMRVLFSALVALSSVAWNSDTVGATERACYGDRDPKGGGYLHAGEPSVLASGGRLDDGSIQYPLFAYSLAGTAVQFPHQICLRYELEFSQRSGTTGPVKAAAVNGLIQALRWPDIGLPFVDVDPGQRVSRLTARNTAYQEPAPRVTTIKAFSESGTQVCALFSVEQAEHELLGAVECAGAQSASNASSVNSTGQLASPAIFNGFQASARFPRLVSALADADLPLTPVLGFPQLLVRRNGTPRPLVNEFSNGGLSVRVSSDAQLTDRGFALRTAIEVVRQRSSETQVNAPTLVEPPELEGPADELAIRAFAVGLQKKRKTWIPLPSDGKFDTSIVIPYSKEDNASAFFQVSYPITVRADDRQVCMSVFGYSPFPVAM